MYYWLVFCDTCSWNHDNDTVLGIMILDTTVIPELRMKLVPPAIWYRIVRSCQSPLQRTRPTVREQWRAICFTVTWFPHCSVQSLPTVEWFKRACCCRLTILRGIMPPRYTLPWRYRYHHVWYHDTYRYIAGIAQHYCTRFWKKGKYHIILAQIVDLYFVSSIHVYCCSSYCASDILDMKLVRN